MTHGIGAIHVRRQRGKLAVQAQGRTGRGQRYIKETVAMTAKSMSANNFKSELSSIVKQMLPEEVTQP